MPWLWALTGNSLLDGHECVVGQISQLHLTASERGRPSLSLQLWKVSYPHKGSLACRVPHPPQPLPTSSHGKGTARWWPAAGCRRLGYHFCILAVSHLPQQLLHERRGVWGFFFSRKKSFPWAWKSIFLCVHARVYASASPGKVSNFRLNACHFVFVVTRLRCFSACSRSGCCGWWLCAVNGTGFGEPRGSVPRKEWCCLGQCHFEAL